ncbi:DUF1538 family protein [Bacillus sp. m3-13]|uniref:DUF1538 family protein n=1 Tax=Bacillus sp. m3-13 TaxID=406124 RepID=UPI002E0E9D11
MGIAVTVAEPDVRVLATQVDEVSEGKNHLDCFDTFRCAWSWDICGACDGKNHL